MVTVFGDYYDHISDTLKVIAILTSLYIIDSNKFFKIIPIIISIMILMLIHIGCQEHYYNEEDSPTLDFTKTLCPIPSEYSKEELKSTIQVTRIFGVGTLWITIILSIIYYDCK